MKNLVLVLVALLLLSFSACGSGVKTPNISHVPIPSGEAPSSTVQLPDDVIPTPGGVAYRANVIQSGVPNAWPSIPVANINLGKGKDIITVYYRPALFAQAGESHNDIIEVSQPSKPFGTIEGKLAFYTVGLPLGITVVNGGGGGRPGVAQTVLVITVGADVTAGYYNVETGIIVDGKDYGTVTCTVNVPPVIK